MRLFSIFFFIVSLQLAGQGHTVLHYTDQDILPNNTVRCLFKANDGTLWIGTDNGLLRKFNNEVTAFYKEDGLPQNNIWALAQDKQQTLWIGSYGNGLATYSSGKIAAFSQNDLLPHLQITKLLAHNNQLYVGTSDGLAIINLANPKRVHALKPALVTGQKFRVLDFYELDNAIYAVTYAHGIFKIVQSGMQKQLVQTTTAAQLYAANIFKENLYLSGKESFQKIPLANLRAAVDFNDSPKIKSPIFWDYQQTKTGLYAAGWGIYTNDGGLYKVNGNKAVLKNGDYGIESSQITSLAYDAALDLLYVGTLDNGYYEVQLHKTVAFQPVNHDRVIDLASAGEETALLFNDGLSINGIEINSTQFKKWQENFVAVSSNSLPKYEDHFYELDYNTKAAAMVFYSVKAHNRSFWVNTSLGIYVFDKAGTFEQYLPLHTQAFNFTPDGALLETNFYHGSRVYTSLKPLAYTYYDVVTNNQNPQHIVGTLQHGNKTYLTSIFNGLYAYENGTFTSYLTNKIWQEKRLRHSTAWGTDRIAVSNEDGDVFLISDSKQAFTAQKIKRDRAYGNSITFLSSYKNYLIMGTSRGVVLYNDGKELFINKEQGLKNKVSSGAVQNGILLLGSKRGFYKIALDAMLQQENRITSIKIADLKINGGVRALHKSQLDLDHDDNSLQVTLSTNQHPFPDKLQYSYRINAQTAWLPVAAAVINLPYLEPASYNLQVKINDASTGSSYEQALMQFTINPPFYKSWWFVAGCFIAAVGLLLFFLSLKRKRTKKQAIEQEKITKRMEEVKLEALLSQMNPHFVFNALNTVQYFISKQENDRAMRYLSTFALLIRTNLKNSTRPFLTLEEELRYLKKYIELENARFDDRIKTTFTVDSNLSLSQTSIPTMVLQPFVENAFVHAFPERIAQPHLEIAFMITGETQYRCAIIDNGIGSASFTKNKRYESKGRRLVEERLSFLGYDPATALKVKHTVHGTSVTLLLTR